MIELENKEYIKPNPKARGEASEYWIIAHLMEHEISVSKPIGDNKRYDLLVDSVNNGFLRIQCKTARLPLRKNINGIIFNAVSVRINSKKYIVKNYLNDAELFAIYCPFNKKVYIVPVKTIGTKNLGSLYFNSKITNQYKDKLMASDYEFEKWIDYLK